MTLAELRAYLGRPVLPVEEVQYIGVELSALIDIAERVANDTTSRPNVEMCCKYCFEDEPTHATDCVWVAARALAGGE